jgi:signal recognition particle receptor subunit beta
MDSKLVVRLGLATVVLLAVAVLLVLFLIASNLALSVRDQLQDAPAWLIAAYVALLALFALTGGIVVWRLLKPGGLHPQTPAPPDEGQLRANINRHAAEGVDIAAAQEELHELDRRRADGQVYIALYGEISSGKTSLVRALVPAARAESNALVDVRGGTTRAVSRYTWRTPKGDRLILADVPGFNEAGDRAPETARDEALRAHLVVYVCEGDLTRDQWRDLEQLQSYRKPLVVAVNKSDRYQRQDLGLIEARIRERLSAHVPVVAVQAGGCEEVMRVLPDGREETLVRERAVNVESLVIALQDLLMERHELLSTLRDHAIILLAADKLEHTLSDYRRRVADSLVERYTRRAVVGGLAAFAPGVDVIIQGTLATAFVRALCDLYEVSIRQVDVDTLLGAIKGKVGRSMPLILAIAGNALKAFPGLGTVAGGLTHAVAYGLLFQSLGRALVQTLSARGALDTRAAMQTFEDQLREDMAARARELAALALAEKKRNSNHS